MKLSSLVRRQPCEHLVEYMIIALAGRRAHHSGLVQEIAVDLRSVERAISHLHLDEVTLSRKISDE